METGFIIIQNLHRYTLYIALLYILILYYDAYHGLFRDGEFGKATNAGPEATTVDPFKTRSELKRILDERE